MKAFIFFISISTFCFAQNDSTRQIEQELVHGCFPLLDSLPQLIGSLDSLQSRLKYPKEAIENNIEGKVYVVITIDTLGIPSKTEIVKGIGYGCNEEAVRLIKTARFSPAILNGKYIRCKITIPILFRLPKEE